MILGPAVVQVASSLASHTSAAVAIAAGANRLSFKSKTNDAVLIKRFVNNAYMNPKFNEYKKNIIHPVKYRLFMLGNLPSAFFAGIKIASLSEAEAQLTVPQKWFNKNPFRSIYLAVLSMAAEISTGVLCMGAIYQRKPAISMLAVGMQANFLKKATGKITFTCTDGRRINEVVEQALETGESRTITCISTGRNAQGDIVAEFSFTWSFKARKQ